MLAFAPLRASCPDPGSLFNLLFTRSFPRSKEILANDGVGVIVRSCRWRPHDPAFRPKQEVRTVWGFRCLSLPEPSAQRGTAFEVPASGRCSLPPIPACRGSKAIRLLPPLTG